MMILVENLNIRITLDIAGLDLALLRRFENDGLGSIGMQLGGDAFDIKNDLRNIFFNVGDYRDFMKHAVNLDAGCRNARKRA